MVREGNFIPAGRFFLRLGSVCPIPEELSVPEGASLWKVSKITYICIGVSRRYPHFSMFGNSTSLFVNFDGLGDLSPPGAPNVKPFPHEMTFSSYSFSSSSLLSVSFARLQIRSMRSLASGLAPELSTVWLKRTEKMSKVSFWPWSL